MPSAASASEKAARAAVVLTGLLIVGIHPNDVDVSLSVSDWKALDKQLAKEHADSLFEGVGVTGEIVVKGVRYVVRFG